jgi:hypothetical protein
VAAGGAGVAVAPGTAGLPVTPATAVTAGTVSAGLGEAVGLGEEHAARDRASERKR